MKKLKAITKRVTSTTSSSKDKQEKQGRRFSLTSHRDIQVVRNGYNVDLTHVDDSFTKLHRSCLLNESEEKVAKAITTSGLDPNQVDRVAGSSPIHLAVVNGNIDIVRVLLLNGADINLEDGEGKTPLIKAVECSHESMIKFLLYNSANPNLSDRESGNTPLLWALNDNNIENARLLLNSSEDIDVNRRNVKRETALHIVSRSSRLFEVMPIILDSDATINAQEEKGRTPLMIAAVFGNKLAADLLVQRGADVSLRDSSGYTARDLAKMNGFSELSSLIEGQGILGSHNSNITSSRANNNGANRGSITSVPSPHKEAALNSPSSTSVTNSSQTLTTTTTPQAPVLLNWSDSEDDDNYDSSTGDTITTVRQQQKNSPHRDLSSSTVTTISQQQRQMPTSGKMTSSSSTPSSFNPVIEQLQKLQGMEKAKKGNKNDNKTGSPPYNLQPSSVRRSLASLFSEDGEEDKNDNDNEDQDGESDGGDNNSKIDRNSITRKGVKSVQGERLLHNRNPSSFNNPTTTTSSQSVSASIDQHRSSLTTTVPTSNAATSSKNNSNIRLRWESDDDDDSYSENDAFGISGRGGDGNSRQSTGSVWKSERKKSEVDPLLSPSPSPDRPHASTTMTDQKSSKPEEAKLNDDFIQNLRELLDEEVKSNDDLDKLLMSDGFGFGFEDAFTSSFSHDLGKKESNTTTARNVGNDVSHEERESRDLQDKTGIIQSTDNNSNNSSDSSNRSELLEGASQPQQQDIKKSNAIINSTRGLDRVKDHVVYHFEKEEKPSLQTEQVTPQDGQDSQNENSINVHQRQEGRRASNPRVSFSSTISWKDEEDESSSFDDIFHIEDGKKEDDEEDIWKMSFQKEDKKDFMLITSKAGAGNESESNQKVEQVKSINETTTIGQLPIGKVQRNQLPPIIKSKSLWSAPSSTATSSTTTDKTVNRMINLNFSDGGDDDDFGGVVAGSHTAVNSSSLLSDNKNSKTGDRNHNDRLTSPESITTGTATSPSKKESNDDQQATRRVVLHANPEQMQSSQQTAATGTSGRQNPHQTPPTQQQSSSRKGSLANPLDGLEEEWNEMQSHDNRLKPFPLSSLSSSLPSPRDVMNSSSTKTVTSELSKLKELYEQERMIRVRIEGELDLVKKTSHAFSEDYHSLLKEKISLEENFFQLQSTHTKAMFELDKLKGESCRLPQLQELIDSQSSELEKLRKERDELFSETLHLKQKVNVIRDEMNASLRASNEAFNEENERRFHEVVRANSDLVSQNEQHKKTIARLQAELARIQLDHETEKEVQRQQLQTLKMERDALQNANNNNNNNNSPIINRDIIKSIEDLNHLISQWNEKTALLTLPVRQFPPSDDRLTLILQEMKEAVNELNQQVSSFKSVLMTRKVGDSSDELGVKLGQVKSTLDRLDQKLQSEEVQDLLSESRRNSSILSSNVGEPIYVNQSEWLDKSGGGNKNTPRNRMVYPSLLSRIPVDRSPRSLFVRTLLQLDSGHPNNRASLYSVSYPSLTAGNNFHLIKSNLEKEISKLKQQLGLFCNNVQSE